MPAGNPITPAEDDLPDIAIEGDDVILIGPNGTVTIPGRWIEKHSPTRLLGGDAQPINRLSLTIFAGKFTVDGCRDDVRVIREECIGGIGYGDIDGRE